MKMMSLVKVTIIESKSTAFPSYTTEKTVPIVLEVLLREFLISKRPLAVKSLEPLFSVQDL